MYTIFKNDTSIILTDDRKVLAKDNCFLWIDFNQKHALNELIFQSNAQLYLYDADLKNMWTSFKNLFKVIEASGGIVKNDKDHILFIFRHGKWDLPKGKIELDESREEAGIREVEEECGLHEIKLLNYFETSYHIYKEQEEEILKVSYWYQMYSEETLLIPQTEEGITDLAWVSQTEIPILLQNTYPNIALLIGQYSFNSQQ